MEPWNPDRSLDHNEPLSDGPPHGVRSIRGPELADDRGDVELDRLIADPERRRDRFVGKAFRHEGEHLALSRRQRLGRRIDVVPGVAPFLRRRP